MPIRRAAVDLPALDEADAEAVRGLEQNGSADNYCIGWKNSARRTSGTRSSRSAQVGVI
jgi:hypothetical protein